MSEKIEFTDRYRALGMEEPDPETMCRGQCEGVGVVPEQDDKGDWQFVTCPDCQGTGKRDKA